MNRGIDVQLALAKDWALLTVRLGGGASIDNGVWVLPTLSEADSGAGHPRLVPIAAGR